MVGCSAYLTYLCDLTVETLSMEFISIACEFPDIFSIDLPWLPPTWEIDFSIKVESGTKPISISPYRMAPTELKELSSQL